MNKEIISSEIGGTQEAYLITVANSSDFLINNKTQEVMFEPMNGQGIFRSQRGIRCGNFSDLHEDTMLSFKDGRLFIIFSSPEKEEEFISKFCKLDG